MKKQYIFFVCSIKQLLHLRGPTFIFSIFETIDSTFSNIFLNNSQIPYFPLVSSMTLQGCSAAQLTSFQKISRLCRLEYVLKHIAPR